MTPFTLRPVAPLGTEVVSDICTGLARELLRYPASPRGERLMLRRSALNLSLRDAAAALGLRSSALSDLEHGRAVLESDAEWDRAEQVLRDAATGPTGVQTVAAMMRGAR